MSGFKVSHIIGYAVMNDSYEFEYSDISFGYFFGVTKISLFPLFIHQEDRGRFIERVKEAKDGKVNTYVSIRLKNGSGIYVPALVVIEPEPNEASKAEPKYRVTAYDIINLLESCKRLEGAYKKVCNAMQLVGPVMTFDLQYKRGALTVYSDRDTVSFEGDLDKWESMIMAEELIDPNQLSVFHKLLADIKRGVPDASYSLRLKIKPEDPEYIPVVMCSTVMNDQKGNIESIIGIMLKDEPGRGFASFTSSNLDPLTGVFNKSAIRLMAENAISNKEPISLIVVDLDHFKEVNDNFGHMHGDRVIATAARVLKETVGNKGYVGRIGGDEFLIIIKDVGYNPEDLRPILRAIKAQIEWVFRDKMESLSLTTSIGSCCYPIDADNFEDLFKLADYCLYLAKRKGRNCYVYYNERFHGKLKEIKAGGDKISAKSFYSDDQKLDFTLKALDQLMDKGKACVREVVRGFCTHFDADEFHVYRVSDWLHAAKPLGDAQSLESCWDEIKPYFDNSDLFHIGDVRLISRKCPRLYNIMVENGVTAFCIYAYRRKGEIAYIAALYNKDEKYKWSDNAVKMAATVLKAVGNTAMKR